MTRHIVIVGSGITGLSAAFYLQKEIKERDLPWKITLLESEARLGGKMQTEVRDGFIMERGPDSFLGRKKSATSLIEELGLSHELVRNKGKQSYILHRNRLVPMPEGTMMGIPSKWAPFAFTPLISFPGKVRAAADLVLPRSKQLKKEDLSIGAFFRYRFGNEVVERIIEPLLSGIYAGNIDEMSLQSLFPQFLQLGEKYRSMMIGMKRSQPRRKKEDQPKGAFLTLKSGLHTMVEELEKQLSNVKILKRTALMKIEKGDEGYRLWLSDGSSLAADAVAMTVPHQVVYEALGRHSFLKPLHGHPTSVATIILAFDEKDAPLKIDGSGFLIPRGEDYTITACTWTHKKWPHTAPPGKALLRCYIGRAGDESGLDKSDEEMVELVIEELKRITPIGKPEFACVTRWPKGMPQFAVGHQAWLKKVRKGMAQHFPGIFLAGSAYDGFGIPDCIEQGKKLVPQVIDQLSK